MINKVILIGRLTSDPIIQEPRENLKLTRFTVATNSIYNVGGEQKKSTSFIQCIAFNNTAQNIGRYGKKGSLIYLEGRIETSAYESKKTGKKEYSTSVIVNTIRFLESKSQNNFNNNDSLNNFSTGNSENNSSKVSEEKVSFAEDIDWGDDNE